MAQKGFYAWLRWRSCSHDRNKIHWKQMWQMNPYIYEARDINWSSCSVWSDEEAPDWRISTASSWSPCGQLGRLMLDCRSLSTSNLRELWGEEFTKLSNHTTSSLFETWCWLLTFSNVLCILRSVVSGRHQFPLSDPAEHGYINCGLRPSGGVPKFHVLFEFAVKVNFYWTWIWRWEYKPFICVAG